MIESFISFGHIAVDWLAVVLFAPFSASWIIEFLSLIHTQMEHSKCWFNRIKGIFSITKIRWSRFNLSVPKCETQACLYGRPIAAKSFSFRRKDKYKCKTFPNGRTIGKSEQYSHQSIWITCLRALKSIPFNLTHSKAFLQRYIICLY